MKREAVLECLGCFPFSRPHRHAEQGPHHENTTKNRVNSSQCNNAATDVCRGEQIPTLIIFIPSNLRFGYYAPGSGTKACLCLNPRGWFENEFDSPFEVRSPGFKGAQEFKTISLPAFSHNVHGQDPRRRWLRNASLSLGWAFIEKKHWFFLTVAYSCWDLPRARQRNIQIQCRQF